jgi:hypothetical protein
MYQQEGNNRNFAGWASRAIARPRSMAAWTAGFLRTRPLVWKALNRDGAALHQENTPELDQVQRRVVDSLNRDGIASVHLDELFPGEDMFAGLVEEFDRRKHEAKVREDGGKPFLEYIYREGSTIQLENPFVKFSLNRRVLDIVNQYMNMCAKLIYFELAISNVIDTSMPAAGSQRWHRDPGMKKLLKSFLYLSDVGENSGPFMYGVGTQPGGRNAKEIGQIQFGRHGYYPPDGAVERVVPEDDLIACTGRAGTLIFCNTLGLHRGGFSTGNRRIMYTSTFVAEGDRQRPIFKIPEGFAAQLPTLDPVSRFAVS